MHVPQRVALMTGGNQRMGFETVRRLAGLGISAVVAIRDGASGKQAVQRLAEQGLDVASVVLFRQRRRLALVRDTRSER